MKKRYPIFVLAIFWGIFFGTATWAAGHGSQASGKVGILLVAFGSSQPGAQVSFDNIEKKTRTVFPDIPVRWAFTSHIILIKAAYSKLIE